MLIQKFVIYTSILFCLFISYSCINNKPVVEEKSVTIIDDIKFRVYCIFCDIRFSFKSDSLNSINYTECELKLDTLEMQKEKMRLGIHFFYNNQLIVDDSIVKNGNRIFKSLIYDVNENKVLKYISQDYVGFYTTDPNSRLFDPLQTDVITFIKANKNKINTWFKQEAIRRKIIDN